MGQPSIAPRAEYQIRLDARRAAFAAEERRHHRLGDVRIAVFLGAVAIFFAAFVGQSLSPWWLILPVAVLIGVGRRLQDLEKKLARRLRAVAFYERGLARLDGRWSSEGNDGSRYLNDEHLYAADLDVVGPGSLFQLLSVARTERGLETLASWLLNRAPIGAIAIRQASIREVTPHLDLREDLAIAGDRPPTDGSANRLIEWGTQTVRQQPAAIRVMTWILSVFGLGALIAGVTYLLASFELFFLDEATRADLLNYFVVGASVCFVTHWLAKRWTEPVLEQVRQAEHDLRRLADVLQRLEQETFTAPHLAALHGSLFTNGIAASASIARLELLVSLLNARRNELMKIVGPLLLWDIHLGQAIEDWRRASGSAIGAWLDTVGEFEALASLAGFAWERPTNVFPEVVERGPQFDATNLHHPLLPVDRAVSNDVQLSAEMQVLVVSGSNMSGKSTLLRTIGINAVLAQAGAPVCATRLRLSPLVVGASIRIQDSLQEGTSRFYAEISRLSGIMNASTGPVPVLFLIDEFLHGTNSHDRLIGAEAVVRGLAERGAIGLITTHDLALTRLVETLGSRATNVHFQDYLENGRMRFDYRMRPGVVQHSNALALMRSVGLDV